MRLATQEGLTALHEEAGGAFQAFVLRPRHAPWLAAEWLRGSAEASRCLALIEHWRKSAPRLRPLCMRRGCRADFDGRRVPGAFLALIPLRDDAKLCLFGAICSRCAMGRSDDSLLLLFRSLYPDLRPIDMPPPHLVGHA